MTTDTLAPAVEIRGATKRFGSVIALEGVDLTVEPGEIHALVGENGAGKTTLMKALYGAQALDAGTIRLFGERADFKSSKEAIAAGVGMVSQHYGILGELTCLQNLILGAEEGALLSTDTKMARAEQLARSMGFPFDWDAPASELSPTGAQRLEILKLLWRGARVMILDEPTAMLSPSDGEALFGSLTKLVREEGATVILVTHRLPEVFDHCRNVTVLRGGKLVAALPVREATSSPSPGELASLIVGGEVREPAPRAPVAEAAPVLEVRGLTVLDPIGGRRLDGAVLSVRPGEVVGIAGVDGNGQRELFQAILGVQKASGDVTIAGEDVSSLPTAARLARGVRLIAEDRHDEAVVEGWSLVENAALGLQRQAPFARGPFIATRERKAEAGRIAERFRTRFGSLGGAMAGLSGGNQQRFVAARALGYSPKVVLAFQPARGLDLNSTVEVYDGIREACREGAGALVVSFDLDELLTHCDRIVVLSHGQLTSPPQGHERDRELIGRLMVGAA